MGIYPRERKGSSFWRRRCEKANDKAVGRLSLNKIQYQDPCPLLAFHSVFPPCPALCSDSIKTHRKKKKNKKPTGMINQQGDAPGRWNGAFWRLANRVMFLA